MSTPNHLQPKNARFADKNEVFLYTDTKSNGEEEQWLLSSPIQNNKQTHSRFKKQTKQQQQHKKQLGLTEIQMDIELAFPPEEDQTAILLKQYQQHMNSYSKLQLNKQQTSSNRLEIKEKQRERQRQEILRMKQQQQLQRKRQEQLLQQEQKVIQQSQKMKQLQKTLKEKQQEQTRQKMQIDNVGQTLAKDKKKKQRVTLNFNEWLKDVEQSNTTDQIQPKEKQQERIRNSINFNNRITMDLKGISSLFEENYIKYENISSNKNKEIISRSSLGRKSLSVRNTSKNPLIEKYIHSLQCQDPQEQEQLKFYHQLEQITEKRLKASESKIAKLQDIVKSLQQQLRSLPDQSEEQRLNIEQYEQMLQPLKILSFKYSIDVLIFQINQQDAYAIYCQFILDNNIFCKLKREGQGKKAEIRLTYSGAVDINTNNQILIDMNSRLELLKIFFTTYLQKLRPYQILQQIGIYYDQFKLLQDDLSRCCSIFAVKSMELSRSCESITFQLTIKPQTSILVTIKLLHLLQSNYYQFYHIQARKEIIIPDNSLKGDDFIDIIEAMFNYVS